MQCYYLNVLKYTEYIEKYIEYIELKLSGDLVMGVQQFKWL